MKHFALPILLFVATIFLISFTAAEVSPATHPTDPEIVLTDAEKSWLAAHRTVRVRIGDGYPPFEFFSDNRYQGMAYEYLTLVGKRLGIDFQPVTGPSWPEALSQLKEKRGIDLILCITHTAERESSIVFTKDYLSFPQMIFSVKDGHFISGIIDLAGRVIAVERGFVMKEWLQRDIPGVRLLEVNTPAEALEAVSTSKADAYIQNLAVGTYLIDKKGLVNIKVAAPASPYEDDRLAMGVRNDWPELARLIDKALASITPEEHQTIRNNWLSLRIEHGIRLLDVIKWSGLIASFAMVWILLLRRAVKVRTAALQLEVERRRTTEEVLKESNEELSATEEKLRQQLDKNISAHEELLKNQELLKAVIDNTFHLQGLLSPDGRLIEVNQTALDLVGQNRDNVIGCYFWDTPWWSHNPALQRQLQQDIYSAATGAFVRNEAQHPDFNGNVHTIDFSLKPMKDSSGKIIYIIAEGSDITELKNMESRLAAVINSTTDLIWSVDLNFGLLSFNNAIAEHFRRNYGTEICIGSHVKDLLPPEFADKWHPFYQKVLKEGPYKIEYVLTDGRTLEIAFQPIVQNNKPLAISVFGKDITERKKAENALWQQSRLQKLLLKIAATYINLPLESVISAIHGSLGEMAEFVESDRVYIFDYDFQEQTGSEIYEWYKEGLKPTIADYQSVPFANVPEFNVEAHRRGEPIWIQDVQLLPPCMLRTMMERDGNRSILSIPCIDAGTCIGFVGFAWANLHPAVSADELSLLQIFASMVVSIQQRQQADAALKTSEARLQLYFQRLPSAAIVWGNDFRVQQWNPAAERIFGYSATEALGRTANELVVPEHVIADVDRVWHKLLEGNLDAHSFNENRTREGIIITCSWTNTPLHDREGKVIGVISVVEDITERVRMEIALRESEEQFRQVFSQNDDAILLIDLKTFKVIDANTAALKLYNIGPGELDQLIPENFIERNDLRKFMEPALYNGIMLEKATSFRPDGSKVMVSLKAKIIHLKNELAILCSVRDITEKIRLEEEMKATQAKMIQANKMTSLGMLVSGVGHEINNPNQCIASNATVLAKIWQDAAIPLKKLHDENEALSLGGLPFAKVEELAPLLFTGITNSSRKINKIISNMRDFVKQEKTPLKGLIDINKVVDAATSILWHHVHKHTENFNIELQEGLPLASGSAQQIEQVIINLLTNALQSLQDKSRGVYVKTSADPESGVLVISIRDEGKGMSREVLEKLTEPFYTTKSEAGGTGLGLYISDNIIKEHHGSLSFSSEPGTGTTATISLPMMESDRKTLL